MVGALLWLLVVRSVRSDRRSAPVLTVAVVAITALAALLLASTEYGAQIFPPVWGVLPLLPPAAGVATAVLLLRRGGARSASTAG